MNLNPREKKPKFPRWQRPLQHIPARNFDNDLIALESGMNVRG